jgi:hypothetical protein
MRNSAIVVLGVVGASLSLADAAAPKVHLSRDSVVQPRALNFARGEYGTCINGQTFQIEAVVTCQGWQYATCFDGERRLCVARRRLPADAWQSIAFDDYKINHTDVHNVPVIGICRADGTIHLAFDHHCSPLHYRVSRSGAATSPEAALWTAALFGPITAELARGAKLSQVTYPAFVDMPDGRLLLVYRIGGSGNGDTHLAQYDPKSGLWTVLGAFISGAGDYRGSATRNAYPNGFDYDANRRLHSTWVWREGRDNQQWGLLNCHDLLYACSDDGGRTWQNTANQPIATTGRQPIAVSSPKVVVCAIPWRWGIMNQVTQAVDAQGRVHVVLWQNPPDAPAAAKDMNQWRYIHYWRDEQGVWRQRQLPVFGRKPALVADQHCNLVLVYTRPDNLEYHGIDPGGPLCIATASAAKQWTDWREVHRSPQAFVGEPRIDKSRWQQERILSVYAQESPAERGKPSVLRILDFSYE